MDALITAIPPSLRRLNTLLSSPRYDSEDVRAHLTHGRSHALLFSRGVARALMAAVIEETTPLPEPVTADDRATSSKDWNKVTAVLIQAVCECSCADEVVSSSFLSNLSVFYAPGAMIAAPLYFRHRHLLPILMTTPFRSLRSYMACVSIHSMVRGPQTAPCRPTITAALWQCQAPRSSPGSLWS